MTRILSALLLTLLLGTIITSAQNDAWGIPAEAKPTEPVVTDDFVFRIQSDDLAYGDVQVTLRWASTDDLDLEVVEPSGEVISWQNPQSATGGQLDRDSNADCRVNAVPPVENIIWPSGQAPAGEYTVRVRGYRACDALSADFSVEVLVDGQLDVDASGLGRGGPGLIYERTFSNIPPARVSHIEASQVVQDENNDVELVNSKPTLVRVYPICGDSERECRGPITGVYGELTAGGQTIRSVNEVTVTEEDIWPGERPNLEATINFTLPPGLSTGSQEFEVKLFVDAADGPLQTNEEDPDRKETFTVQETRDIKILYVPIELEGSDPPNEFVSFRHRWAEQTFPVTSINHVANPYTIYISHIWGEPTLEGFFGLETNRIMNNKMSEISAASDADYVVGFLSRSAFSQDYSTRGWYPRGVGGNFFFVLDSAPDATYAHELGHTIGLGHANTAASQGQCGYENVDVRGWPYADSTIQEWAVDPTGSSWALKDPDSTYDLMAYCDNNWFAPYTYNFLIDNLTGAGGGTNSLANEQDYLFINGLVNQDGTAGMGPTKRISTSNPILPPQGGDHCVELQDATNAVLDSYCFTPTFSDSSLSPGETWELDSFALMLPAVDNVTRIIFTIDGQQAAEQVVTANAPVVTVTSPNGGEAWAADETQTITWTATDADADDLTFDVYYSADGTDWQVIGLDVLENELELQTTNLPGSATAQIRVVATDGFNTTEDISDAVFTVEGHQPEAYILMEEPSLTLQPGEPLVLRGYGYDAEDLTINDDAGLGWSSSIDGDLGNGEWVYAPNLSVGQHTLTVTVTDSDGNTATDTRTIEVLAPTAPAQAPALLAPANGAVVNASNATLGWSEVDGGLRYQVQIDNNADFSSPERDQIINSLTYYISSIVTADYNWRVRAVNDVGSGPWSMAGAFTLNTEAPVSFVLSEMAVNGALTEAPVYPTFTWIHDPLDASGEVPADWYRVYVQNENGAVPLDEWYEAATICEGISCSITPDAESLPVGLTNGDYAWFVQFLGQEIGTSAFEPGPSFTVAVAAPTVDSGSSVVDASTGRPVVTFNDDPNTSWIHVYVGTPDFNETVDLSWYPKADADCDGMTCTLLPAKANPANGDYVVYFQFWGPGGYNNGDSSSWSGPYDFSLNRGAAGAVDPLTITATAEGATFNWGAAPDATWYQFWVGTDGDYQTSFTDWLPAADLGCADGGTCTFSTPADVTFTTGEIYVWWARTWGPGGFDEAPGWQEGTTFTP